MFDIGFWEIFLILMLALIVLGPERLPQAARTVGHWVGKARRYIEGVKSEVEKEFDTSELKRMLHNQEVQIRELQSKLTDTEDSVNRDYQNMFEDSDKSDASSESEYDIIEEDDDEYQSLEDTPKKNTTKSKDSSTTGESQKQDTDHKEADKPE